MSESLARQMMLSLVKRKKHTPYRRRRRRRRVDNDENFMNGTNCILGQSSSAIVCVRNKARRIAQLETCVLAPAVAGGVWRILDADCWICPPRVSVGSSAAAAVW